MDESSVDTTSHSSQRSRRTAEGLSKREIIRCLKRYLARELFALLRST